uniref:Uncharacterized protein n=1 Tax=Neolamprologus brichardi TaxID=32507 RepID=A0A3Q4GQ13_NEOBR
MLNVKEQRIYQATKPQYSLDTESGVLELTVLGACQCVLDTEPCPCSRTAAASRKQLVQLQQEVNSPYYDSHKEVFVFLGPTWQHMTSLEFSKVQHFQKLDLPSLVYYHSNLKEALIFRNSHLFLFQNLVSFLFLLA